MAPIVRRREVKRVDDEEENEQRSEDKIALAFKTEYVFDISQTDGKPLPEFSRVNGDPGVYTEKLKEYVASRGVKLEYSDAIGSAKGVSAGGLIILKKN